MLLGGTGGATGRMADSCQAVLGMLQSSIVSHQLTASRTNALFFNR